MRFLWSCFLLAVVILLLWPTGVGAQVSLEVGLQNAGPLVEERTQYVRLGAMGNDVYVGVGIQHEVGPVGLTAGVRVMPTYLYVWSCPSVPCPTLDRWSHRPTDGISTPVWFSQVPVGVVYHRAGVRVAGGMELSLIHAANYHGWGASPMGALGAWGDLGVSFWGLGLVVGASYLPPYNPRWTVLQEWSGGKPSGRPTHLGYENGSIWVVRLGAKVVAQND
jgi:hypothetical protein